MWFGDLVTMKWWNDLWLNESFAEYASTLATAEATEWTEAWTTFAAMEKSWAYRQDQLPSTHPIVATINDLEDVQVNFDGITYAKGASVLKQLVAWVGQDDFLAGVAQYFKKHAHGNTELRDLLVELEATSGRDLDRLVEEVARDRRRQHAAPGDRGGRGRRRSPSFAVLQTAAADYPTIRPHRLAIGFYNLVDGAPRARPPRRARRRRRAHRGRRARRPHAPRPRAAQRRRPRLREDPPRRRSRSPSRSSTSPTSRARSRARSSGARCGMRPATPRPSASDYVRLVLGNIAPRPSRRPSARRSTSSCSPRRAYVAPERQAATTRGGRATRSVDARRSRPRPAATRSSSS